MPGKRALRQRAAADTMTLVRRSRPIKAAATGALAILLMLLACGPARSQSSPNPVLVATGPAPAFAKVTGGAGGPIPYTFQANTSWVASTSANCPGPTDSMLIRLTSDGHEAGPWHFILANPPSPDRSATVEDQDTQAGGPGIWTLVVTSYCNSWAITISRD